MSKIIVEDLTQPPTNEAVGNGLSSILTIYASNLGTKAGLDQKQVALATLQAAEEMLRYLIVLERISEKESDEIRYQATENAEKRLKSLDESGTIDAVKKIMVEKEDG